MKILIVSQYFWPENFRINDLALELRKKGHHITVLTGKPNYPQGKYYKGYSFFGHSSDTYEGIKVFRVPVFSRGNGNGFNLAINYMSFVIFSCLFIFIKPRKFDLTLTFAISPITQVFAALLHKKLFGSITLLWVQDLWPESVFAAGKMNYKSVYRVLSKMVKYIYKRTDKILVSSEAFSASIESKGVELNKIGYLPNWAEVIFTDETKFDLNKYKELIPKGFIAMFAGNIGESQDFDSILKAAELTKNNPDIKWVIVGDGRKKSWVEEEIEKKGLQSTFFMLGRYPSEEMPIFFTHANVMLVTLKDTEIFGLTIPSKVQAYMAFGKPVLTMLNGIGSQIINEANCGFTANAGDYIMLARNVIRAANLSNNNLNELGKNAHIYYRLNFSMSKILNDFENICYGLVRRE